jgi:glycosyltransferase 2 family protein
VLVGVYYLLPQLGAFRTTYTVLRHASPIWLLVGLVTGSLTFLAGAVTQYAAGNSSGRFSDISLLQFAGTFINHFLPFSLGGVNLTARYYQKLGTRQAQAITMATIPIVFGVITTLIMVALISPITLVDLAGKLRLSHLSIWWTLPVIAGIGICAFGIVKYRQRVKKIIKESLAGLKSIGNIRQLGLLVGGSVAITLLSAMTLLASIMAIHASVALIGVFTLYVTASLVSNIAPTPDGIGATEAVLVLGLVAARLHLPEAAAATLLFRFITFWLPIIPGGLALRYLNRHKTL